MAQWKVVADKIQLFPHTNSDKMLVGKVGKFQVCVSKDNGYKDGDAVVFAPERSILPEELRPHYCNTETGASYLQGENHDRVGSVRLRGELSEGVTLPLDWVRDKLLVANLENVNPDLRVQEIPLGVDLSPYLGITKYTPEIPAELIGKVSHMNESEYEGRFVRHDVENFHTFKDEFTIGEMVDLTEKVHGSQVNVMLDESGRVTLTSKYLGHEGMIIDEDENNKYWRAAKNSGLLSRLRCEDPTNHTPLCGCTRYKGLNVQVVGEVIPFHKGFSYGQTEPTLRVFKLIIGKRQIPLQEVAGNDFFFMEGLWVPVIARIPFDPETFAQYADGREQVSGKELHIREGVVITPVTPRLDSEGHGLAIKFLNSKFKGSPTDFS